MDVSSKTEDGLTDKNMSYLPCNRVNNQEISSNENNIGADDELSVFRQQWRRELEAPPSPYQELPSVEKQVTQRLTDDEKARRLFLRAKMLENKALKLERPDKLYRAMLYYKRAVKILPDVETRLYEEVAVEDEDSVVKTARLENTNLKHVEKKLVTNEMAGQDITCPSDEQKTAEKFARVEVTQKNDGVEGEDLICRLNRVLASKDTLLEAEHQTKGAHISWLPYEVILVILRWVVSSELDAASLEHAAAVCRGLYVAAREPDIWRSLCVKTWGIDCGTPRASGFSSWRQMYVERPRLNLDGVYICLTAYDRLGEHAFVHSMYRPLYHVEYYRYFRFFPEGLVLLWTSSTEPVNAVGHLKYRDPKPNLGIWAGQYRLIGDKVVIVMKRTVESSKIAQDNPRYRLRHQRYDVEPEKPHEHIFLLELSIRSFQTQQNARLVWSRYFVRMHNKRWSHIEVRNSDGRQKFPALKFSRVRSYTEETHAPLLITQ